MFLSTKKKSAVTKVTALFLFPSHSNPNSHFITSTFLLCECEVPKYQDKCESEGSFSLRSSLLFLAKHPITSIRNEMKDIRVPATKKKSAVTKVIALFLFPSHSNPNSHFFISAFLFLSHSNPNSHFFISAFLSE